MTMSDWEKESDGQEGERNSAAARATLLLPEPTPPTSPMTGIECTEGSNKRVECEEREPLDQTVRC